MKIKIHFIYLAVFTVLIKFPINLNLSFNELFIISNYYMNGSYLLDIFHTLKYCMPLLVIMLFVMLDINNIEENKWIISSRIGGNKKLKRYINKIVLIKSLEYTFIYFLIELILIFLISGKVEFDFVLIISLFLQLYLSVLVLGNIYRVIIIIFNTSVSALIEYVVIISLTSTCFYLVYFDLIDISKLIFVTSNYTISIYNIPTVIDLSVVIISLILSIALKVCIFKLKEEKND
ncbi:hypothetical protein [Anaerorhabdus sp.]|uniref:hypothetical protein n=1 Tax=Anaerorhabdus sp. TaxID=1872524 RepID=UPI002FC88E3F